MEKWELELANFKKNGSKSSKPKDGPKCDAKKDSKEEKEEKLRKLRRSS